MASDQWLVVSNSSKEWEGWKRGSGVAGVKVGRMEDERTGKRDRRGICDRQ